LQKKTEELAKASRKHYELEQELVFYKMDEKFSALGKPPGTTRAETGAGATGESPYVGKARYIAAAAAAAATVASVRFSPPRLAASQHELSTPAGLGGDELLQPARSPLAASPQLLDYRQR
uniref:Coiled-coil domain containing 166 n=1 Tax=Macrostomum lignano TaxID=282301 RepID=A0A1I8I5B7_9PLAT